MEKIIFLNNQESNYYINDKLEIWNRNTHKQLKGTISQHGYRVITFSFKGKKINKYLHRIIAQYFLDFDENSDMVINHKDGNKLNNSLENLEIVSQSENAKHAIKQGLRVYSNSQTENNEDLMDEKWVPIIGYSDYEVSSFGRVRSHKYKNPRILKQDVRCGYKSVVLSNNGITKHFTVHELVYFNFKDEEKISGKVIDHIDGNKLNNCLENLRYISQKENSIASLYNQNNKDNRCKKVLAMKDNLEMEFDSISLAAQYTGVDGSSISKICKGHYKTSNGWSFKYR